MSLIEIDQLSFGYTDQPVLDDISMRVESGEVVALLGPNGSGKTTLLKLLLGLFKPLRGQVRLNGRRIDAFSAKQLARNVAYVPQVHRMAFGYSVLDIVLMGRMSHKGMFFSYSKSDEKIAREALERMGIAHLGERPYTEISGGERQLTLIARALTQGAEIFVMDEPVNGLDYGHQIRLLSRIAELAASGYTFIKTTHYPDHALWISDRVVMLKEGKILADGPAHKVVCRQNLSALYNAQVDVCAVAGGVVCIPEALQRGNSLAGTLTRSRNPASPLRRVVGE
ncbi:ABC transporter ATP-binding protein [Pelobacter seleniigenes]|uniref:ABC transporter ATP-binding protein n=1 Tax=Pelobacter seleniigenes TaxID=407188 RepID=UPI0007AF4D4A|nr:ABC transporter ATP-binding protein [Pelobacter seleniigenes]